MIINSILQTDLYKLTVAQIVYHRYSNVNVEYTFQCRNAEETDFYKTIRPTDLLEEFYKLKDLFLTQEEKKYLQSLGYFEEDFLRWLQDFRFDPSQLVFENDPSGKVPWKLRAKGSWLSVILFETIVLSIVNEIYFRKQTFHTPLNIVYETGNEKLKQKIDLLKKNPIKLIEFGTRRRFSGEWQEHVIKVLKNNDCIFGTSNVYFAKLLGIKEIGSWGHEFPMSLQGLYPPHHSQREAFKAWLREYKGIWGTCLTDTFGDEKFLKDFSFELAKGYDGVRHDSGDPYKYTDMIIKMYEKFGINPMHKYILFSDGLDIPKAIAINDYCRDKIQCSFGIGTNLTNDVGFKPLSIVMKVTKSHGQPVAKLSANPEKSSCEDPLYLEYLKHVIKNY